MVRTVAAEDLLPLVDALADGAWHSGEDLGAGAGLTRAGLAKRIDRLREWGLVVEARQGLGYRFAAPIERLDAARLQALAPSGVRVSVETQLDSTNRALMDADAGDDPQALLAEFQSAGRGRRGREWRSPFAANLYLSLAWTFPAWPPQLPALSLAAGVACVRALRAIGVVAQLKWPNDLQVQGRKLGGILIEHRGESAGSCRVVVGIGINVAMRQEQGGGIDQPWTALDRLDRTAPAAVSRNALAAGLIAELVSMLKEYSAAGFESCRRDWEAHDALRDREVMVLADPAYSGIARGIDAQGALIVEMASGRRSVHAGEVSLRAA
jgi:BirA family biotin operon repressor/biotin-[acetyl-CoA-carboxylase] ligase